MTSKGGQIKAWHVIAFTGGLAALIVGIVVVILMVAEGSNSGVRVTAYAGECTMNVTYTVGSAPEITAKDVRGGRTGHGRLWDEWRSPNYDVPSGTKVTMKAVAHPCSKLVREPRCVILYKKKPIASAYPTTDGECSAEGTVP